VRQSPPGTEGRRDVAAITKLLHPNVTAAHQQTDIATCIRAVAFSWLTVGTDAHSRNYALTHTRTATRLAPCTTSTPTCRMPPDERLRWR